MRCSLNELSQHRPRQLLTGWNRGGSRGQPAFAALNKGPSPTSPSTRGAVLLEVILALGLMLFAAAVINHGMQASVDTVDRLKYSTHAQNLAVSVMSQIHMGILPMVTTEAQPFTAPFEDWTYEIETRDFGESLLNSSRPTQVEVIVRHATLDYTRRMTEVFLPNAGGPRASWDYEDEEFGAPAEMEVSEEP